MKLLAALYAIAVCLFLFICYNTWTQLRSIATDIHAAAVELQRDRAEKDSVRALFTGMLVEWESARFDTGYVKK